MRFLTPFAFCVLSAAAPTLFAQTMRFEAALGGAFEVPQAATTAFGSGVLLVNASTGAFTCTVETTGVASTMAHIHTGAAGVNGPVLVTLTGGPSNWSGTGTLAAASIPALVNEGLYLNVHSVAFPGGELRGQLIPARAWDAEMDGLQETPPNPSLATGAMRCTLAPAGSVVSYTGSYTGITLTNAHIHVGLPGVAGPVVYGLAFGGGLLGGSSPALTATQKADMFAGRHYANLHTAAFPGGEIRGQLEPGPLWGNGDAVSLSRGGRIDLRLAAPSAQAGRFYLLLGSASGTAPGLVVDGQNLPLNFDPYFNLTLQSPGVTLVNSFGFLDGAAMANARFQLPPGISGTLAGNTLHHAYAVLDLLGSGAVTFTSSPWAIALIP